MRNIYLASASERRQEIFRKAGLDYIKMVAPISEDIDETDAARAVEEISRRKGCYVAEEVSRYNEYLVVGADTLVSIDGRILGKPENEEAAREYIELLSGKKHQVVTGVSFFYDIYDMDGTRRHKSYTFHAVTDVYVADISQRDMEDYIASGEWKDKAGGYAIQGLFCKFVSKIEGEYENVVGFPIAKFYSEIGKLNIM